MRYTVILAAFLSLFVTGCASIQYAGVASYSFKDSVTDKDGSIHSREVTVRNGKEIADLDALIQYDGYTVHLKEAGVAAFKGQEIAAGATKEAIADAAKIGVAAALAPVLPMMLPAAGAALAAPGLGAAAVGAAAVVGTQKLMTPAP